MSTAADVATTPPAPASCGSCAIYGSAELLGNVTAAGLDALSGMAASWRNPGVVYVHNDRGRSDLVEFFALSERGAMLGRLVLTGPGASAHDVEDMEVGRCPAGTCIYLADIGNNISPMRSELVIFRAPEPEVHANTPGSATTQLTFERFTFSYPDGGSQHNAESLMVDPMTGTVYIIDKVAAGQRSTVFKLPPLVPGKTLMATKIAELPVPMAGDQPATAAAAHPCGAGFLLRTNNTLYEFRIPQGAPFDDAFRATPQRVPFGDELQSEAVTYAPDGRGYYTTSERARPPIHRVTCRP